MQDRIGVIVNVHSLFHAAKEQLGAPISYQRLMADITEGRRCLYATACVIGGRRQQRFLGSLRVAGLKAIIRQNDEELRDLFTMEMIRIAPLVDTLVLVTVDRAVLPILDYLEDTDRHPATEVWTFDSAAADNEFREGFDKVVLINDRHIYEKAVMSEEEG